MRALTQLTDSKKTDQRPMMHTITDYVLSAQLKPEPTGPGVNMQCPDHLIT